MQRSTARWQLRAVRQAEGERPYPADADAFVRLRRRLGLLPEALQPLQALTSPAIRHDRTLRCAAAALAEAQ